MDIDVRDVGSAPLFAAFSRERVIVQVIKEMVERDENLCLSDPSTKILAMIIDILIGRNPPYLVEKRFAETDMEMIFGKGQNNSVFNDKALARTLDKIYATEVKKVFCYTVF